MRHGLKGDSVVAGHPGDHLALEYKRELFRCDGCQQVGFGKRYSCLNPSCEVGSGFGFHLHKDCAEPASRRTHWLCKGLLFEYRSEAKEWKQCHACGDKFEGCFYQGYWDNSSGFRECKPRNLHLSCIALPFEIDFSQYAKHQRDQLHQVPSDDINGVVLVLRKELPSSVKCSLCYQKKADGAKTWAYVSQCSTYAYHVRCLRMKVTEYLELLMLGVIQLESTAADGHEGVMINWMESLFGSAATSTAFRLPVARLGKGKGSAHGVLRVMAISKVLLTILVAAFIGDPISIVATVASAVLSH